MIANVFPFRCCSLERVLWRATRGNMYFRSLVSEHDPDVYVFVVLFQGAAIDAKVTRVSCFSCIKLKWLFRFERLATHSELVCLRCPTAAHREPS